MRKIYIFDVDGTLTPSRRRMTEDFARFFDKWSSENIFYLVSGSDLEKMREQVPLAYLDRAQGIFTCGGNKFYIDGELQYENIFRPSRKLKSLLGVILGNSQYPHRYGNHIEDRGSMVNFSVVGRDCTLEQRFDYFEYDKKTNERQIISVAIKDKFPELDAVIGGQISIDIAPKGNDKSQVIDVVKKQPFRVIPRYEDEFIFIGDRTMEGGNDYPLAKVMKEMDDCQVFQAGEPSAEDGYKTTQKILEELND